MPFSFPIKDLCQGSIVKKLDTGDYSMEGYEDILCIERKRTVSEIAQNITQDRFKNELCRMSDYKYKFIIYEFDWLDVLNFPYNSNLPKSLIKRIRTRGKFLQSALLGINAIYNVHTHYAGSTAKANDYCNLLMSFVWKRENGN